MLDPACPHDLNWGYADEHCSTNAYVMTPSKYKLLNLQMKLISEEKRLLKWGKKLD